MVSRAGIAGIEWGVHARFLRYLAALVDGACRIGDGVRATAEGSFLFPRHTTEERCNGFVEFSGHSGLMHLWLARPGLEVRDDRWVLTMEVDRAGRRSLIADLSRRREGPRTTIFASSLREEAVHLFGGAYEVGESLADLVLRHHEGTGSAEAEMHAREREMKRWPVAKGQEPW